MNVASTLVNACTAVPPEETNFPKGGPSENCTARDDELLDERALSKLRWRCRRGLLENDLFIERFFNSFQASLTVGQGHALGMLMELSDNDLLDVQLARKSLAQVSEPLDREAGVHQVLSMLRKNC
jgi:antitoxin CptB